MRGGGRRRGRGEEEGGRCAVLVRNSELVIVVRCVCCVDDLATGGLATCGLARCWLVSPVSL